MFWLTRFNYASYNYDKVIFLYIYAEHIEMAINGDENNFNKSDVFVY